jgi:hypothetical protein
MGRELGRSISVGDVRPAAAHALAEVFDLSFDELPAEEGARLWRQPARARLGAS